MTVYLILDTESSIALETGERVVLSLAYEVVSLDPSGDDTLRRLHTVYDIVAVDTDTSLDTNTLRIHGISKEMSLAVGKPLRAVLQQLTSAITRFHVAALVGHDIVNDITLLVGAAIRVGLPPQSLAVGRLICTKVASHGLCAIPLPPGADNHNDDDVLLKWPNLTESYTTLVPNQTVELYPTHDARGDVSRCRDVLQVLLRCI